MMRTQDDRKPPGTGRREMKKVESQERTSSGSKQRSLSYKKQVTQAIKFSHTKRTSFALGERKQSMN